MMSGLKTISYILLLVGIISSCSGKITTLVTLEELETKTGENNSNIWLSILGEVYDVTTGRDHYGPGQSYTKLAARDSSVPFITGTFTAEEAEKDPVTLNDGDISALMEWQNFYSTNDKYSFVGLLVDPRFHDDNGAPQPSLLKINERIQKIKSEEKVKQRK